MTTEKGNVFSARKKVVGHLLRYRPLSIEKDGFAVLFFYRH